VNGKIVLKTKRILIQESDAPSRHDGVLLNVYVLREDVAGNSYYQFEASARSDHRGVGAVLAALVAELGEKA